MAGLKGAIITIDENGLVIHRGGGTTVTPKNGVVFDLTAGEQITYSEGEEVWKANKEVYAAMAANVVENLDHSKHNFIQTAVSSSDFSAMFEDKKFRQGAIGTKKSYQSGGFMDETVFGGGSEAGVDMNSSLIIGMRGIEVGGAQSQGGRNYLRLYTTGTAAFGALAGATPTGSCDIFYNEVQRTLNFRCSDGIVKIITTASHGHGG